MRILLHSPYYAPELISIGKYNTGLAEWLVTRGHEVQVVTAAPHYPAWRVHEGYSAARYSRETIRGVRVFRCPACIPRRPGAVARTLYALSHGLASLPILLGAAVRWRPDVMLAVEPPLLSFLPVRLAAALCGARTWLHVQDLEVDAAFDLGIVSGASARRLAFGLERWLLRSASRISTISPRMAERILAKGVTAERFVLFPNWADDLPPDLPGLDIRAHAGIPKGQRFALYAGNMAGKQGLETLVEVARHLADRQDIWFLFVGDGPGRAALQAAASALPRVRFLPLQPADHLGTLLRSAHLHLLPQRAAAADLVMPSKLGSMLASGRPTVAGALPGTQVAQVLEGAGLAVEPENASQMAQAIISLWDDDARIRAMGQAAQAYARQHMSAESILRRLEQSLQQLTRSV